MTIVLAVDLGTTGVKVGVVDDTGGLLSWSGEVLPMIHVEDGGFEQDPRFWWDAIGRCSRYAIAAAHVMAADVTLVAVTSQYTSTVAIGSDGSPLANAIMWMDQRGRDHNRAIPPDHDTAQRWIAVHGMAPSGNDDIGHVSIFRDQHPEVYASASAFVEPMDYVTARLTNCVTATQNTMFPMLAVDNRTWGTTEYSEELLGLSGLDPAKLPPLIPLGQSRGPIIAEAAAHLGVSRRAVVTGATIDSVTSAVGTGTIDSTACGIIIGTTTVIVTHVPSKRQDPAHGLSTAPSPLPGQYFLVAENGFGGKSLDAFVNNVVYPDDGLGPPAPDDAYQRVLEVAATAPPGADGVMFMPWFAGSMAPAFQRPMRAGFVNMGLAQNRGHMARAVLEGVAFNAAWLLPFVSALADQQHTHVSFGGGGARSPLWGQILADCFGIPVRRLANSNTTNAQGAALLALVEHDIVQLCDVPKMVTVDQLHEPDPKATRRYRRLLDAYIDFHDRVAPFYGALNSPENNPT